MNSTQKIQIRSFNLGIDKEPKLVKINANLDFEIT
jgi:hypothetical protein